MFTVNILLLNNFTIVNIFLLPKFTIVNITLVINFTIVNTSPFYKIQSTKTAAAAVSSSKKTAKEKRLKNFSRMSINIEHTFPNINETKNIQSYFISIWRKTAKGRKKIEKTEKSRKNSIKKLWKQSTHIHTIT